MEILNLGSKILPHSYVATIGFFDGVHVGHRFLLSRLKEEAVKRGLKTLVITFDTHPKIVVGAVANMPLLSTTAEKLRLIEEQSIDACALLHFDLEMAALSAQEFIALMAGRLGVDTLLVGYDHRFGHDRREKFEDYCRYGRQVSMNVLVVPSLEGSLSVASGMRVSSSEVRRRLADGDVATAATLLGRTYSLAGKVVHGQGLGHTIGFATANVDVRPQNKVLPEGGVYAVRALIEGREKTYHGMLNIGTRPTVSDEGIVSLEVNLVDYESDSPLYDATVRLFFDKRLRNEQPFPSLDALAYQLKQDRIATCRYYHQPIE